MCTSDFGILARVRQPLPDDFEATAADAPCHGRGILGPLMLIARDSPDPLAQLCAVKALALSREPRADEALRRVCSLPTEHRHPVVAQVIKWPRGRIAAECTPRLLAQWARPLEDGRWWDAVVEELASAVLSTEYAAVRPEPWEEAEFAEGYYKEMEDLTLEFGDPDWEIEPGASPRRSPEWPA